MKAHFKKLHGWFWCVAKFGNHWLKDPALRSLMRVGYRTTQGRRQMISTLGWAGFTMKKNTSIKLRTELQSTNLLRKSLGFHFSLMNMIPMMALAIKKKKHREKSIEAAISQMESLRQCPLGWLICAGACLSSHSCSQELSLVIRNRGSSLSLPEDFLQGTPGAEYLLCDRQLTQVISGVFALWGGHCYDSMWKMGTLKLREGKDPLKTMQLARKGWAQT